MSKDTVSMYFIRAAVAHLAAPARARILASVGVSREQLASATARVSADSFARLWMEVARELDDEFFGLDRRRMKVGSFALMSHAALHSDNLEQAIKAMLRALSLFLDQVSAHLLVQDRQAQIRIDNRLGSAADRRFADETLFVMLHGLMCWLIGKRMALTRVEFTGAQPPYAQEYSLMFSEHQRFQAAHSAIHFDAALLRAPIVQNANSIKVFLRDAPQSVFLKYKNTKGWGARLRRRLRACIGSNEWPTLEQVASEMNVTPTTLRRKLDLEGFSFRGIKDDLRREAALHYLSETKTSITEIASLLCFQDVSTFRRAFKKWTQQSPSQYREQAG